MGDALALDPEREREVSEELAEKALADNEEKHEESSGLLSSIYEGIKGLSVDAVETGAAAADDAAAVAKGIAKVGAGIGKGLKSVVKGVKNLGKEMLSTVTEPIKKGLSAVKDVLGADISKAQLAGMVVGSVIALQDVIKEKLTWLWNNTDKAMDMVEDAVKNGLETAWKYFKEIAPDVLKGLIKLGNVIIAGLTSLWDTFMDKVWPDMAKAFGKLGSLVWDAVPDWLKNGINAIGRGFKSVYDILKSVYSALKTVVDWIVGETSAKESVQKAEKAALKFGNRANRSEDPGERMAYRMAITQDIAPGDALYWAGAGRRAPKAARKALGLRNTWLQRGVDEKTADKEAKKLYMRWQDKEMMERQRADTAAASTAALGGMVPDESTGTVMDSVATDAASEAVANRELKKAVSELVAVEKAAADKDGAVGEPAGLAAVAPDSDQLGTFASGMSGGGTVAP